MGEHPVNSLGHKPYLEAFVSLLHQRKCKFVKKRTEIGREEGKSTQRMNITKSKAASSHPTPAVFKTTP